jgi:tRNA threonylcarbamoyladenosine biosynthesis protein TsaE
MEILTRDVEETYALGRRIGAQAEANQFIALHGDLGAGKTHLVRGIAEGARVATPGLVSSPTYVICNIYPRDPHDAKSRAVFHLDAYRTNGEEDFTSLGFDDILGQDAIVVVEWAARIPELLPPDHLAIAIAVEAENERRFAFTATGPQSARLLARIAGGGDTGP